MRAYIHQDLHLEADTLIDRVLGTCYALTPDTVWLLRCVIGESRVERMVESAARRKRLSPQEVRHATYALFGYLNNIGGIRVTSQPLRTPAAIRAKLAWRTRSPLQWRGFCTATLHAYGLLILAATAIWIGLSVAYGLPGAWSLLPMGLLGSCVLHELGHATAVRLFGLPAVLLSSFGYMAVVYSRPAKRFSRCIAAAGPFAAIVPYGIFALCSSSAVARALAGGTALIHASALLPWSADGKTVWRNI